MDDVILVSCGGGAGAVLGNAEGKIDIETLYINSNSNSSIPMVDGDVAGCRGNVSLASSLATDNEDAITERLSGYRIAIILSILGGGTGTGMIPVIIRCARRCGCKVVSVIGVPMQFENERRKRAMIALPEVVESSDRALILDVESLWKIDTNAKFKSILGMMARSIAFSIQNLRDLMEGPFFSTFYAKAYTFAYISDTDPSEAVRRALNVTMFETDPSNGKLVVMVGAGFGAAEMESIHDTVASMSGIVPDIVKRRDLEDTKVLVFIPVRPDAIR